MTNLRQNFGWPRRESHNPDWWIKGALDILNCTSFACMECCLCCPFCFTTFSALFTLGKSCPLCFNLTRDSLRVGGNFSSYLSHSLKLTTELSGRRAVCNSASLPLIKTTRSLGAPPGPDVLIFFLFV